MVGIQIESHFSNISNNIFFAPRSIYSYCDCHSESISFSFSITFRCYYPIFCVLCMRKAREHIASFHLFLSHVSYLEYALWEKSIQKRNYTVYKYIYINIFPFYVVYVYSGLRYVVLFDLCYQHEMNKLASSCESATPRLC